MLILSISVWYRFLLFDNNLSPNPFPCKGRGEKEERGQSPLSKILSPSPRMERGFRG